ncbi:MAG: SDR family NAD(P)-dependent oxidoreductase [Acidobacteriota bacterium]|nr:SDR family NAD(P)-dependent oxidoreductase [Acidobacteriota bacterium]MDE3043570.1 SDR family NAD(P)-dependent oxidoreductase [Acidobacteriota bacterium]MDE3107357.1 SDR family NAD(P)-dependent oxidoreductase [Acidobacteriota bacterium]MDE3222576.1 SDR family NAD(P)-dependent oxidoreductase [Acidobacteriota bacterium]
MTLPRTTRVVSPFGARSRALDVAAGHDLSGRFAVVTGASSGLGVETARALVETGARVLLAVRDLDRGETSRQSLLATHPGAEVEVATLDLGDLASIRAFVAHVLARNASLDLLINNAAVMATPRATTSDGFELQFGTNHLGHFALTTGLLPLLLAAKDARVVCLSSIGHRRSPVDFTDPFFERRPYDKWSAYGQSKTACALFAVGLDRRYRAHGLIANAVHPGGIMTGLQKYLPLDEQIAMGWRDAEGRVNRAFKDTQQGAATSVWAALGEELNDVGGLYLEDCAQARPFDEALPFAGVMAHALDPDAADRLWDLSEQLTNR